MKYLLDADWAIQALLGKSYAVSTLEKLAPEGIAISWITIGELYEGAFGFANPQQHLASFREFIRPLHTYGVNDPVMERFAEIRGFLRRRGQIIPDFDILLAATAACRMVRNSAGVTRRSAATWFKLRRRLSPVTR